uniref:Uncharacterized protein n=1 Tax=Globisporangium ultimum (strain ATCC 200006 / CBS 805.95 / DAOM BR144) TaxID=431595 RepID=K3X271_GLOUD
MASSYMWSDGTGEHTERLTASDEVWETYLEAHPKAKEFQSKPLPFYEQLHEIFSGQRAARTSTRDPRDLRSFSWFKRRRSTSDDERVADALKKLADDYAKRVKLRAKQEKRTPMQEAIVGCIERFGGGLNGEEKLKFAVYFMRNLRTAEAYNVLDAPTKSAFVANLPTTLS